MAITFNSTANSTATGATSLTYSLNNVAGNLLVVGAAVNNRTFTVTGVTYGGVAMTKAVSLATTATTDIYTSIWYLVNPATGSNNVVVSASASCNINSGAISFTGADTASPLGNTNTKDGSAGTSDSISITTASANSVLVDCWNGSGTVTNTAVTGTNQTKRWANDTSRTCIGSSETTTATGSYSLAWSWTGTASFGGVVAEFKAASTANGNFLMFM